jgi:hypothetical protein
MLPSITGSLGIGQTQRVQFWHVCGSYAFLRSCVYPRVLIPFSIGCLHVHWLHFGGLFHILCGLTCRTVRGLEANTSKQSEQGSESPIIMLE